MRDRPEVPQTAAEKPRPTLGVLAPATRRGALSHLGAAAALANTAPALFIFAALHADFALPLSILAPALSIFLSALAIFLSAFAISALKSA